MIANLQITVLGSTRQIAVCLHPAALESKYARRSTPPHYIAELTGRNRVYAVLGGMHLGRANVPRLEATVAALERYRVRSVGTAHCTGMRAGAYLWSRLPNACFECAVGTVLTLGNEIDGVH